MRRSGITRSLRALPTIDANGIELLIKLFTNDFEVIAVAQELAGRFDGIAPPANGEAIAERVAGANLRVYQGGHAFFAQDPAALADVLALLAG